MPVISSFHGIVVRMYKEKNMKHNLPHIHAEYIGDGLNVSKNRRGRAIRQL